MKPLPGTRTAEAKEEVDEEGHVERKSSREVTEKKK